MGSEGTDTVPAQIGRSSNRSGQIPRTVHMMAYEVYKHVHGEQTAMIEGNCRGGFGAGELIAFLYARNFPRQEWRKRVDEALNGYREAER